MNRILTLDELANFCKQNNFTKFSSKDNGYKLVVKVPDIFEIMDEDNSRQGLMALKVKVCHTLLNRNNSYIAPDVMAKALPSLKNRPILAAIHKLDDGTYDFHGHDMDFDEKGNAIYLESQVGSFTEQDPEMIYDPEMDKTYVISSAVIPEEYSKAASIIRSKNGSTKVSCELTINEMSYNSKENYIEILDFVFYAVTLLGKEKDGTEIGEGMLGARADISDFSLNKTDFEQYTKSMVEMQEKIDLLLSRFNINENLTKGGENILTLKELMEKYSVTEADITFETEGLSSEELEAKFEETFGTPDGEKDPEKDKKPEEGTEDPENGDPEEGDPEDPEDGEDPEDKKPKEKDACGGGSGSGGSGSKKKKKYTIENEDGTTKTFELSLDEKECALNDLVNSTYSEDDCWYGTKIYESYVIMWDYCNCRYYKQSYSFDGENFSLDGERVEVYAEYLTKEEQDKLAGIRASYDELVEYKAQNELKELNAQRDAVLNNTDYSEISATEEFTALRANKENYSVEELAKEADALLGKFAKTHKDFAFEPQKKSRKIGIVIKDTNKKVTSYGSLFSK